MCGSFYDVSVQGYVIVSFYFFVLVCCNAPHFQVFFWGDLFGFDPVCLFLIRYDFIE